MKDFEGTKIKVYLNSNYGWVFVTGAYVKCENNFLAIYNPQVKKIQYFSLFCIKDVEIMGEYKENEEKSEDE